MNVFFTCKNTLVILLQLYRLYVVYSEHRKRRPKDDFELTNISIISKPDMYGRKKLKGKNKPKKSRAKVAKVYSEESEDPSEDFSEEHEKKK